MTKQNQFDNKYKLIQEQNDDDDEQIKKTLNFFDSILDPYLNDEDVIDEKSTHQVKPTTSIITRQRKHDSNVVSSNNTHVSPSPRYELKKFAIPPHHIRRYTSENNLNQINSSSKPTGLIQKTSLPPPVRTIAVSTEDLSTNPSWKKFSPQTRHSVSIDKTNGTSASLIDLTSIDKESSRPRFRFIPSSNQTLLIQEESEIEQKRSHRKYNQVHNNSNRTSLNNQTKYSHKIVKPVVIIPPKPKSAPINRLIESSIHHQNGNSAFKPPRSSKNFVSSQFQPVSSIPNTKRTEPIHKPNVQIGITNSNNQLSNADILLRRQQTVPQFHHSMLNLSSIGIPETGNTNIHESRIIYQPRSSNFMRPPPYTPQSNKLNRHYQYPPPPAIFDDPTSRWIQQVNNSSSKNRLVYLPYNQPDGGGGNRSQQQIYPYSSYISASSGLSQPINSYDHLRRQQPYINPVNIHKYPSPQYSTPVQSIYSTSVPVSKPGIFPSTPSNIYHFNQNNSSREGQSRQNPYRQNVNVTTYL